MNRIVLALRTLAGRLPFLILGAGLGAVVYLAVEARALDEERECQELAVEAVGPFDYLRDAVKRAAVRDVRDHVDQFRAAYERCR